MAADERTAKLVEYDQRRAAALAKFDSMKYGARQDAAYDTRINPSTVSAVLRGRTINEEILGKLEKWLEGRS